MLDVKTGDGALMQNLKQTKILAKTMVNIGKMSGKKVSAVITSMDEPLDRYIGNSLEIQGATEVLSGEQNELKEVAKALAVEIMLQSGKYDMKSGRGFRASDNQRRGVK